MSEISEKISDVAIEQLILLRERSKKEEDSSKLVELTSEMEKILHWLYPRH